MNKENMLILINLMKNSEILFEEGLTDKEISAVEDLFSFSFPPDLREFLQTALPIKVDSPDKEGIIYSSWAKRFPNWRKALNDKDEKEAIFERLSNPLEGLLFDVEHNDFWLEEFGERPINLASKKATLISYFQKVPKLIPLYSHRYLPANPFEIDNPIFSIYQADIIIYGNNLASYFANEFNFNLPEEFKPPKEPKKVSFWSNLL
ncbi:hypothetical protein Dip510_001436 [Elusimicrobium posterum]|uniref:hypothetical protein n=1 Tax=Elusimicrobium posterum TaxID=3116653 RepID=UPI003C777EF5